MFEDRTFENIINEMMEKMPQGIDTSEGSLIYHACAKMAVKLEQAYIDLDIVYENAFSDTADREHLIRMARDRGIYVKEATYAIVKGTFNKEIPIGARFSVDELNYIVVEHISDLDYQLKCETAGKIGNVKLAELIPIEYIESFEFGKLTGIIIPAEDEEETEAFRERYLASFAAKAFGGNRADYKANIESIRGIGGCKIKRRKADPFIHITIIDSDFTKPSQELVEDVQNIIDPTLTQGEGDGLAPISHQVKISPVNNIDIHIQTRIIFEEEYDEIGLQTQIQHAIDSYFKELASNWAESSQLVVRILQIETRIAAIKGIIDVTGTKINGVESNVILGELEIPVRGVFNIEGDE